MSIWRASVLLCLALLVGCSRYEFTVEQQTSTPYPPINLPPALAAGDLYVVVFAEAKPPARGSTISACASSFVGSFVRSVQKTIALSVVLEDGTTKIPLYAVSQSTENSCLTNYNGRFVFSPQTLPNLSRLTLNGDLLYDVKSTESVSKYMADANNFALLVAPQSAPVIAGIDSLLGSNLVNDIKQDVNDAFSQDYDTGMVLADLSQSTVPETQAVFNMTAYPADGNNRRTGAPPILLGTLTVTTQRTSTLIGAAGPSMVPDYSRIQAATTQLTTIVNSNGQTIAQPSLLFNLANAAPSQAAGTVASLGITTSQPSATDVRKACDVLEGTLASLKLNRLDTVAFLWRVYSDSPYAAAHDAPTAARSDCLSATDFALVKALGIQGWPAGLASTSVPSRTQLAAMH